MSTTAVQKAKVTPNVPAAYDEELAAEAAAIAKRIGAPSGDTIGINKDKTFRMPNSESAPVLEVVVAGFVDMNQLYEGKYDANNVRPPICMALGTDIDLMQPFDKVPKKQNSDCKSCWANQWKTDGGNGKACKNQRMLALLSPKAQGDGPLMLLKVSPTGVRFWDSYVTQAQALAGHLIKVITEISFDPKLDYASLRFRVLGLNDTWQDAFPRRISALERLLTEPDFAPAVIAAKPKSN